MKNFLCPASDEARSLMQQVLASGVFVKGLLVEALEKNICAYTGARYAVAFSSGSEALRAAYYAAEISSKDRLIVSAHSSLASTLLAQPYRMPISITDIDNFGHISFDGLPWNSPPSRGRSCIVVEHFGGRALNMRALNATISTDRVVIIENGSQSLGSCYPSGEKVGSCLYSDMTVFSFYNNFAVACGEGGCVTTHDERIRAKLIAFRDGMAGEVGGVAGYMTEMQAALACASMSHLDHIVEQTMLLAQRYGTCCSQISGVHVLPMPNVATLFPFFVVKIPFADFGISQQAILDIMSKEMPVTIPGTISSATMPHALPGMQAWYKEVMLLPILPGMTVTDIDQMVLCLRKALFT